MLRSKSIVVSTSVPISPPHRIFKCVAQRRREREKEGEERERGREKGREGEMERGRKEERGRKDPSLISPFLGKAPSSTCPKAPNLIPTSLIRAEDEEEKKISGRNKTGRKLGSRKRWLRSKAVNIQCKSKV